MRERKGKWFEFWLLLCLQPSANTTHTISVGHAELLDHQDKKKKEGKHVGLSMHACPVSTLHVLLWQALYKYLSVTKNDFVTTQAYSGFVGSEINVIRIEWKSSSKPLRSAYNRWSRLSERLQWHTWPLRPPTSKTTNPGFRQGRPLPTTRQYPYLLPEKWLPGAKDRKSRTLMFRKN